MKTSPSEETITVGQATKALEILGHKLRKSGLPSREVQEVLEHDGPILAEIYVVELRKRVEALTGLMVRHVVVDRTRTLEQVIVSTGRKQYITKEVMDNSPLGEGLKMQLVFFKPDLSKRGNEISDDELELEYTLWGLIPADPLTLATFIEQNPEFADETPCATHWKNAGGKWCYEAFDYWRDKRHVNVYQHVHKWNGLCSFAGLRKK